MKRPIIAMTLTLLVGCATGVALRDLVVPARAQNAVSPNFEFTTLRIDTGWTGPDAAQIDQTLNQYGRQGFHLVGVYVFGDTRFVFERPVAVQAPPASPSATH
jgi:hypothetical protein